MDRILVTGAGGFVGKRLVDALIDGGKAVTVVTRAASSSQAANDRMRVIPIAGIDGMTDWRAALEDCTTVIHMAAQVPGRGVDPAAYDAVNNRGTARLAEQAGRAGVRSFVFASSIFALADNSAPMLLDDRTASTTVTAYGQSKLAAEKHVAAFAQPGRPGVSLRPPLVYGGAAKGNWLLLQKLAASPLPLPFGAVGNRRSLIALENLVDAFVTVASQGENAPSGAYALSEDAPVSLTDILTWLRQGMGKPRRLLPVPPALLGAALKALGRGQMAASLLGNFEIDSSRFRHDYGWTPKFTTREGRVALGRGFHQEPIKPS